MISKNIIKTLIYVITVAVLMGCAAKKPQSRFDANADASEALKKYTELGLVYIQQGKINEAKRPLKRALEIDPDSADVHNALALMYGAQKESALAEEHFNKSLINGGDTHVRRNYAALLFSVERVMDACKQLELAAKDTLYESRASIYENLGVCRLRLGQKKAALTAFDKAVVLDDSQSRALLESALLHFELGHVDRSRRYHAQYQKLVRFRIAPNTPRHLWLGIRLARLSGDKNKEASFQLLLKNMFPNSLEYTQLKGGA